MKKQTNYTSIIITLTLALLASCAKKAPYEEVFKGFKRLDNKSATYDTGATYLYVPQTQGVSADAESMRPFYQGNERLVKIRFIEDGLEVYEIPKHSENSGTLNEKIVLTIPGTHKEFKCAEDSEGNCTNQEEENTKIPWQERSQFEADLSALKVHENNYLDIVNGDFECIMPVGSPKVIGSKIEKGVINIFIQKNHKIAKSWGCILKYFDGDLSFSNNTFKTEYSFSIVDLNKLASKNYEKVDYPKEEHDTFGFFKQENKKFTADMDASKTDKEYLLNRWNPKNKKLTYYLSESYYKKKNKHFLKATKKAIKSINNGLKEAQAGFQIVLKNGKGKHAGDLLNNMIVLIDDVLNVGLLGYGPTVVNPKTGEIVQGHINMYSSTLTSMTEQIWENMVELSKEKKAANDPLHGTVDTSVTVDLTGSLFAAVEQTQTSDADADSGSDSDSDADSGADSDTETKSKNTKTAIAAARKQFNLHLATHNHDLHLEHDQAINDLQYKANNANLAVNKLLRNLEQKSQNIDNDILSSFKKARKEFANKDKRLAEISKNTGFCTEFFQIAGTAKALVPGVMKIKGVLNKDGTLKTWKELSKEVKAKARIVVSTHAYTTTFIHEMGHNLGLRHNFKGSWDSQNFYSEEESRSLGMKNVPAYSSIMDYGFSELNELSAFGKYDIAALRYGYARKVESKKGKQLIPIKTKLSDIKVELWNYEFCTDEDAGQSYNCSRFDEGSNPLEIAEHMIYKHKHYYKYRNLRGEKEDFSKRNEVTYTIYRMREFEKMKSLVNIFKIYEKFYPTLIGKMKCMPVHWENYNSLCKMIEYAKPAAEKVANYLADIIAEPDHTCALAQEKAPNKIVKMVSLQSLYEDGLELKDGEREIKISARKWSMKNKDITSCYNKEVKEELAKNGIVIVGETGKFLNSFSGYHTNAKTRDQIGVRGVWYDKLVATMSLMNRTFNDSKMALSDMPIVKEKLNSVLRKMIQGDEGNHEVTFTTENGQTFKAPLTLKAETMIDGPMSGNEVLAWYFGLNKPEFGEEEVKTPLLKGLMSTINDFGTSSDPSIKDKANSFAESVSVGKRHYNVLFDESEVNMLKIGKHKYFKNKEDDSLFNDIITQINNANEVLELFSGVSELSKTTLINSVLTFKDSPIAPESLSEIEKSIFNNPTETNETLKIVVGGKIIDSIIKAVEEGKPYTQEFLENALGKQIGYDIFMLQQLGVVILNNLKEMGVAGVQKVMDLKKELIANGPETATGTEKKLYKFKIATLKAAKANTLDDKIASLKSVVPLMPFETIHE